MPYLKQVAPCPEPLDCRILTAALELFVDKGYHNVSIHEIQKLAAVSIGSIYNHFGGKEGVAKALYRHLMNEMDELIDEILRGTDSPAGQCRELIRRLFGYTETHRSIMAFIFHAKHREFLPDEPGTCEAAPFVRVRGIIAEGIRRGEFALTDSFVATAILLGGAVKLIQLRLDGAIDEPLTERAEAFFDAAWSGLGGAAMAVPAAGGRG